MTDETKALIVMSSEMLPLVCGECGPTTNLSTAFVDLRRAQVVISCACGNIVAGLGLSTEAYRSAVTVKMDQAGEFLSGHRCSQRDDLQGERVESGVALGIRELVQTLETPRQR